MTIGVLIFFALAMKTLLFSTIWPSKLTWVLLEVKKIDDLGWVSKFIEALGLSAYLASREKFPE